MTEAELREAELREEERRRQEEEERRLMEAMMRQRQMQQSQQGGGMNPGMVSQFMPQSSGTASGGGAMAGMAGPAALAAVIVANETAQRKAGNRPDDFGDQIVEGLTGEGLTRDIDRLTGDNELAGFIADHGNPEGLLKAMKKGLLPWELLKDLF